MLSKNTPEASGLKAIHNPLSDAYQISVLRMLSKNTPEASGLKAIHNHVILLKIFPMTANAK
ncbi:MAG: hypothetical protein L3J09_05170 [Flavobacteriaceae bacterium]|nr:hypothetical protein [Flavobacteriaceae bacterium]